MSGPDGSEREARKGRLSEAKQALLARRLAGLGAVTSIPRRPPDSVPPLSFTQQRLWFLDQIEPGSPAYNLPVAFRLGGALDERAMQRAWTEVVRRHEVLRTVFLTVGGQPVQQIRDDVEIPMPIVDLSSRPDADREAEARHLMHDAAAVSFNMERGPLARASLLRLSATDHILLLVIHHVVFDGWSVGVLRRELQTLYDDFVAGRAPTLPPLPLQYADFAVWQRAETQGPDAERQLSYWRQQLGGPLPVLSLPTDRPRPVQQSFAGAIERFTLEPPVVDAFTRLARADGATLFMALLAAWNVVLARHAGIDDIIVGTPIASRSREELEPLLGFFANTLALRTSLAGEPSFRELLGRVRETSLGAYGNQDVAFERIVEEIRPVRDLSRTPVFQVMFSLEDQGASRPAQGSITWTPLELMGNTARTELALFMGRDERGIRAVLEYSTTLFDRATVRRLVGHFRTVIESAIAHPEGSVRELPMLTPGERRQLLAEWNATDAATPAVTGVHELVQRQAARRPHHPAVRDEQSSLTYAQLESRAGAIAERLRAAGVADGHLVGVCLDRTSDLVATVLAVWKTGAAYVPIDPEYPAARIEHVLVDSGARVVVSRSTLRGALPRELDASLIQLDDAASGTPATGAAPSADASGIAYVIYTSGSTGLPKGVRVPQRAVVNFLTSMAERPGLHEGDVLLALTTLAFDISVLELFLPLTVGATVAVAGAPTARSGERLAAFVGDVRPTVMQATPSTWQMLFDAGWRGSTTLKALCGGEALSTELARRLAPVVGELWNMYGPTETTVWSTCGRIAPDDSRVTIGRPIANTRIYILDSRHQPHPIGVPGELLIGGAGVAAGYHARPELTAERFVTDPVDGTGTVYRTGDLARWLADGTLEHLGRIDRQIKLNGFRIEPGEIESALERLPQVRRAAVVVRGDKDSRRLVAYVVFAGDRGPTSTEIRRELSRTLPQYMVPALVVPIGELPLTANAKVNYDALPNPLGRGTTAAAHEPPVGKVEMAIAAVWSRLLGGVPVARHDNFFELGGHSLLSIRAVSAIEAELGFRIDPRLFFFQNLRQISAHAETATAGVASR